MVQVELIASTIEKKFHPPEAMGTPADNQYQGSCPEKVVEIAGRVCYDSFGKGRSSEAFHQHILDVGHGSVLEHAYFTFYIAGISRALSHELVRHRIGVGISQRSTRFVNEGDSDCIIHPLMQDEPNDSARVKDIKAKMRGVFDDQMKAWQETYKVLSALGTEMQYAYKGTRDLRGEDNMWNKVIKGAARMVAPQALEVQMVWTANARALRNFFDQRLSKVADPEIRLLAHTIYKIVAAESPALFKGYKQEGISFGVPYYSSKWRKV